MFAELAISGITIAELTNGNKNGSYLEQMFAKYLQNEGIEIQASKSLVDLVLPSNSVAVTFATITQNDFQSVITGTSNTSGTFPQDEHVLVLGMRVLTGASATLAATAWATGISDAALLNGRYQINSNNVMKGQGVATEFTQSTNNADLRSGIKLFNNPIFWKAQTPLQVVWTFPAATATANLNLRTELIALKLS